MNSIAKLSCRVSTSIFQTTFRKAFITVIHAILLTACVTDNEPDNTYALQPGNHIPYFNITLNDGSAICSTDLIGAPSMIVLFNTSCPDCRKELPVLNQVAQSTGIRTICIARDETAPSIAAFWTENNLTLPYSPQPDRTIYNLFASETIPRIFIFNAAGIVTAAFSDNPLPTPEMLHNAIANL